MAKKTKQDETVPPASDLRVVSMYGGEVTVSYRDGKHTYTVCDPANGIDGLLPSVTQILKVLDKSGPLMGWATNCGAAYIKARLKPGEFWLSQAEIDDIAEGVRSAHRKVSKIACDIGTEAHDWVASYIASEANGEDIPDFPENPLVVNCCHAAQNWISKVGLRPIAVEEIVYSRAHKFIGTMDTAGGLVEIEGKKAVIDWKSSKGLYVEMRFQLAAYKKAYEEMTGLTDLERYMVKLGKADGEFEVFHLPPEDYEADLAAFVGLIPAAKRLKELAVRK